MTFRIVCLAFIGQYRNLAEGSTASGSPLIITFHVHVESAICLIYTIIVLFYIFYLSRFAIRFFLFRKPSPYILTKILKLKSKYNTYTKYHLRK